MTKKSIHKEIIEVQIYMHLKLVSNTRNKLLQIKGEIDIPTRRIEQIEYQ